MVLDRASAVAVATGTLNAQQAFITGRIRLTGDQQKLVASTPVFVALDSVFATDPAPPLPEVVRERPRLVTSRYRAPYAAVLLAETLGCDAIRLGYARLVETVEGIETTETDDDDEA